MGHTAEKVPDQALNKQTHQDNFCSVTKIDDQKLLEYAALAQALKELSGWDGREAQSKRIEIIKNDVQGTVEFLGKLIPQGDAFIRQAQSQLRHAEGELANLQKFNAPPGMIADQQARITRLKDDVARATRSYEQNAKDFEESWADVRAYFKSVYDQFMAEWNECGLLKAVQIASRRLQYFVVEAAVVGAATFMLGGVLFKATQFTFRIAKNAGRQIYRVRIKAPDDLSPPVVRKLDSRDVGGHEPRQVPDTPPPAGGKKPEPKKETHSRTDPETGKTNTNTTTVDPETGRPIGQTGEIQKDFGSSPRGDNATAIGGLGGQGYDGGHIGGHRFFGDTPDHGIFPQVANFNRGAWKTMENEWADWTKKGYHVDYKADLFPPGSTVPQRVDVSYTVRDPKTGKIIYENKVPFENKKGQAFKRVSYRKMPSGE